MLNNKVCFIIAHKYFKGYESYLKYYIENIQKLYPEALTIVVDNNSKYPEDIFGPLRGLSKVVFLTNDIESKFEVGAYTVGIQYIIDQKLVDEYSYYVCTQDNFILKNFYDFERLTIQNRYALPINSMWRGGDGYAMDVVGSVLSKINLFDSLELSDFCWCSSFLLVNHKLKQLYSYLLTITQKTRYESEAAERYLGRILWELNERRDCGDIDGTCKNLHERHYDCWKVNIYDPSTSFFVKRVQQKTEHTIDKE